MNQTSCDYGPLSGLIGKWTGDKGVDIAPEPDGEENNPYYETILFTPADDVENAESQYLTAIHYRQLVSRKSNDKVFHDETGYWLWDANAGVIMQTLTIPRAVSVIAGGVYMGKDDDDSITLNVAASENDPDWRIVQSPFMRDNATTRAFSHRININGDTLSYSETTIVDIYGKTFEHTDKNTLARQD